MQGSKRFLIISHGPVPTPEHDHVEGGGLRCWGLARGIRANSGNLEITVAYHEVHRKPDHTSEADGIRIGTWDHNTIGSLAREFDSVLISYCMGEHAVRLVRGLRRDQQLILDCYVPIFTEVSARDSSELMREQAEFVRESRFWTEPLRRGDYFLCAHRAQELYYRGVLSAMGRINPLTYGRPMILAVPYGIYRDQPRAGDRPISRLVGEGPVKKILWFGGIYPWFDARGLVDAVARVNRRVPARLVIVGARNPFNFHPDLLAKYQELAEYVRRPEYRDLVIMQDWVHFNRRADWYLDADLVVTLNRSGEENALSWRTRLVDYTWAGVPIATNGGDPLGEQLIAAGAAARFTSLEPEAMARTLGALLEDEEALRSLRENLDAFKRSLYWDVVTEPLTRAIEGGARAADLLIDVADDPPPGQAPGRRAAKLARAVQLARKVPGHLRKHGVRATAAVMRQFLARRLRIHAPERPESRPRIVVLSHRLDLSGAPYVLVDVLAHMVDRGLRDHIRLFTYQPVHVSNIERLAGLGLQTTLLPHADVVPPLVPGDVVLLNTTGFTPNVKEALLAALERGVVKKLFWYVHEDLPERIFSDAETATIRRLGAQGKVGISTQSRRACRRYSRHFGMEILLEPQCVDLPGEYHLVRDAGDFETLRFIMSGTFLDGRKGQHAVLYALAACYRQYFEPQPASYREFTLTFVGVEDDWYSRQVVLHRRILGDRVVIHPKIPREACLELIREANVSICYSQSETGPISLVEGMLAGHPILRNDCSGVDEQLEPGRNGFSLETEDFWQVVETFERMLNRRKTSNEQLAAMSARSHAIVLTQRDNRYESLIARIRSAFLGDGPVPSRPHFSRHSDATTVARA
jgi:glycosyltransferase involved in cell wall biosynthesis